MSTVGLRCPPLEQRILEKNSNIQTVRVYLDNMVLKATIYLKEEESFDYDELIRQVNEEAVKNERISAFETVLDSVDKRMKQ